MAEFIAPASQSVAVNGNVIFTSTAVKPCPLVSHRDSSGIFTLRGGHSYYVGFNANITGATAGTEVDLAIAIAGEEVQATRMASTPAVADDNNNVSAFINIVVPCNCCYTIAVENVGTTACTVSNANLIIYREA